MQGTLSLLLLICWAAHASCGPVLLKTMDPCVAARLHVNGLNRDRGDWSAAVGDLQAVISHYSKDNFGNDPGMWQAAVYQRAKDCTEIDVTATVSPQTEEISPPDRVNPSPATWPSSRRWQETTAVYEEDGYRRGKHSSFKFHPLHLAWEDAEEMCVSEGGHLAVTKHSDDVKLLVDLFQPYEYEIPRRFYEAFLQFKIFHEDGPFTTISGKNISDFPQLVWSDGEPSSTNGREDCVSMYPSGKLNDLPCTNKVAFFCEK